MPICLFFIAVSFVVFSIALIKLRVEYRKKVVRQDLRNRLRSVFPHYNG